MRNSSYKPWIQLFEDTETKMIDMVRLGDLHLEKIIEKNTNSFWKDTRSAWAKFCKINLPATVENKKLVPLWLNSKISLHPLFIKTWYTAGIHNIIDLIGENNQILPMETICLKYRVPEIDFLTYHRLKLSIKKWLLPKVANHATIHLTPRPIQPFYYQLLLRNKRGIRNIYNKQNNTNDIIYKKEKWCVELNIQLEDNHWRQIYLNCFHMVCDNYLNWLQYRIINRILGTQELLFKIHISDNPLCRLCNTTNETLLHLFCLCEKVIPLWVNLQIWIFQKIGLNITLSNSDKILGLLERNNNTIPLNLILVVTKSYIFEHARKGKQLNILELQKKIKSSYNEQKGLAVLKQKLDKFEKLWEDWTQIFTNI